MFRALLTIFALLLVAPLAHAAPGRVVEPETGRRFPAQPTLSGKAHLCLGVGVREYMVFDVYAAALFVEQKAAKASLAAFLRRHKGAFGDEKDPKIKKLKASSKLFSWLVWGRFDRVMEMVFVRDVPGEKSRETFEKGLRDNLGDLSAPAIKDEVAHFLDRASTDIKKGMKMTVRFLASGAMVVTTAGKPPLRTKTPRLSRAVLKIWLGPRPISTSLKRSLVARVGELVR